MAIWVPAPILVMGGFIGSAKEPLSNLILRDSTDYKAQLDLDQWLLVLTCTFWEVLPVGAWSLLCSLKVIWLWKKRIGVITDVLSLYRRKHRLKKEAESVWIPVVRFNQVLFAFDTIRETRVFICLMVEIVLCICFYTSKFLILVMRPKYQLALFASLLLKPSHILKWSCSFNAENS